MNREILFKAKRKSWKELPKEEWWVEGYLFDDGMPELKLEDYLMALLFPFVLFVVFLDWIVRKIVR